MIDIIPAIDIIEGKCVRLSKGDYNTKKIYNENPVEVAKQFQDAGLERLHLVDLDGAKAGAVKNWNVLEKIAVKTDMKIDFSGGIKSDEDIRIVFESGATFASIGSVAVKQPKTFESWIDKFGSEKIILGADVKDEKIAVKGWTETTDVSIWDFLSEKSKLGIKNVFCTDISKDGMQSGPGIELYKKIVSEFKNINLIASGGVATIDDIHRCEEVGCSGVIIGKAIYEGDISLNELAKL